LLPLGAEAILSNYFCSENLSTGQFIDRTYALIFNLAMCGATSRPPCLIWKTDNTHRLKCPLIFPWSRRKTVLQGRQFVGTAFQDRRRRFRFGPLERRLFLIVFAGLLPLALLSFFILLQNGESQKEQMLKAAEGTMRAVVTAVDAELNMSLASLDALATSPRLAQDDFAGFYIEARQLLDQRLNWANIVLLDASGQQVVNVRMPPGTLLPHTVDPAGFDEAVRTGRACINNIVYSQVLKRHIVAARVPILRNGKVVYVLSAVIRPESILEVLKKQNTSANGVVTVLDRDFRIVARTPNHAEWVGKSPSPSLLHMIRDRSENGEDITMTLEGRPVYTAYYRSSITGWTAAIGFPADDLDGPVFRSYIVLGGAFAVSVLLGIFAALFVARMITKPMRELESAAAAMAKGGAPVVPNTQIPEIRQAAMALSAAHEEREKLLQAERRARQLEEEARQLAESASSAKDEFLAMLGHELRNPLAAIMNASEVLELADRTSAKQMADDARAIIRRQSGHLARLTDDLLDVGRVMRGKITLERKPIDLAGVAQSVLNTLGNSGRLSQYKLALSLEPVWVDADPIRMEQIVANLLTNAVKYTPPPGTIAVTVKREGGEAVFRVRDSGLGIEADLLPRLFELFVQGERSLDRSQGGLGIGLTLVRRLTELHGGRVEAASDGPNLGSEFIVRLPAIDAQQEQSAPAQLLPVAKRRRVAIVEDNEDVRISLRCFLEFEGHSVCEAADGPSGVETILRERVDIAFIDVGLPMQDGYAVARAIRSRAEYKIRLVAMSGYGSQDDKQRGMDAGFDAYLIKPIGLEEMNELIAET
jgi:signal transduction histidine kinase